MKNVRTKLFCVLAEQAGKIAMKSGSPYYLWMTDDGTVHNDSKPPAEQCFIRFGPDQSIDIVSMEREMDRFLNSPDIDLDTVTPADDFDED